MVVLIGGFVDGREEQSGTVRDLDQAMPPSNPQGEHREEERKRQ
jgi:hypothetical protein